MKVCTACGEAKDDSEFWYSKARARRVARCNACRRDHGKKYRAANRESINERNREWQKKNPERMKAAHQRWIAKNPGIAAKRTAVWRAANRERALEAQRQVHRKWKIAAFTAYGGFRCACCGETEEAFLSLDHVNNDGAEHRRQVDRRKLYKWLVKNDFPPGFQVLCMNCNFGKARNGGICPHKTRTSEGSTTIPQGSTSQAIGDGSAGLRDKTSDEDIVSSA